jgi:hypothetical protein
VRYYVISVYDANASPLLNLGEILMKRVYTHLLEPKEHPDYKRRHVQPPDWETFDNRTQFTSLRGFAERDGKIVDYEKEIDRYTKIHELGNILWTAYPIIFGENLDDVADEIKRRGLFLFDVWGYVPGSGPQDYWQQFKPPYGVFDMLKSKLGERWLGMDVGEQDGRYIGGYAPQMVPSSADHFQQYLYFQRHFQKMCDELGNRMCTLVSLNFGHYFLKEGVYSLIGAETAQGLPNGQVYYAFIRGAGKQYGVPWFGNISVYNRWGYKTYGGDEGDHGPTKGSSLSLMKRLMISHILYNCILVGFESGWFIGEELSPIGHLQKETGQWVRKHGQLGVMQTPIAIMVDFLSGWSFPRHLYTGNVYRVWGNLPYSQGDYMTDSVLDMLYPGYQDSSYFHDESGFMAPTPYGDMADCILSDAEEWLLKRYPTIVIAGELSGGLEIRDKLQSYIEQGGILVITAGNLAKLPDGLADVKADSESIACDSGSEIKFGEETVVEESDFDLISLKLPENAKILATCKEIPVAVKVDCCKGKLIVMSSPFGITTNPVIQSPVKNETDKPLTKPYLILKHVQKILDRVFRSQMLFEIGEGLSWIVCRKCAGEYTLGIFNSSLQERSFNVVSNIGEIKAIEELALAQSEKQAMGYLPGGFENAEIGISSENTIAGGDVRVFAIQLHEKDVEEIPHVAPPTRHKNKALPLSDIQSIKEAILAKPTFFEHFDSVLVDWLYLYEKEKIVLQKESEWLQRQGLRIFVDLTSGINLYPDLRLLNNSQEEYNASMKIIQELLEKMNSLNAHDLILSLHRFPENGFTGEESWNSFEDTLRKISADAEKHGISVNLRMCQGKPPWGIKEAVQFIDRVGAKNLYLAPSVGLLLAQKANPEDIAELIKGKISLWFVGTPEFDIGGNLWNIHAPLATGYWESQITRFLSLAPQVPIILNAVYRSWDEVYRDLQVLGKMKI